MVKEFGNVRIEAQSIWLGDNVMFGDNVDIKVNGSFFLGDYSKIGDNVKIRGNDILIGKHFYNSSGLNVGGGGANGPESNLVVGDRCVMHNNFINVSKQVIIGDDVGLSPEASILTHGFWNSVFDGYPAEFGSVCIDKGCIIGYRSTVLPWVYIAENCVIGACSVVTKGTSPNGIYVGNPAKRIKDIQKPTERIRKELFLIIMKEYDKLYRFHGKKHKIAWNYPIITCDGAKIDVITAKMSGEESESSDHLRDFLRRFGIRIYTERGF